MSDNQDILNISEIYGYEDKELPNSAYPTCYHDIAKAQKNYAELKKKPVSHKDYTLNKVFGGDPNHRLILQNRKICLPMAPQNKIVDWYHEMLCHPGETRTEHNIRQYPSTFRLERPSHNSP